MSREKFDAIDTDGDGFITAGELKNSLADIPNVSQANIDTIVAMADDNEDGKITYEEYTQFVG
ncbi:MAG: EF-hand domain-containing protein [Actinomycetota bacterium]